MSKTLVLRDQHAEVIMVVSEIDVVSLTRNSGKVGGSITVIMRSGRELPLWFNDDAAMYRVQTVLSEAMN